MLKLFLLERSDYVDYEEARGFVIAAQSSSQARRFAKEKEGAWPDVKASSCERIGVAGKSVKAGIILEDNVGA